MDKQLEIYKKLSEHRDATVDVLWNKIYDTFRLLSDVANITQDKNVLQYLSNVNHEEPHYGQNISVGNDDLDIVLRHYMLEAAMLRIVVNFDVCPLAGLTESETLAVIRLLEDCFAKIFAYRGKCELFLFIKLEMDKLQVYAERHEDYLFHGEVNITPLPQ